MLRVMRKYQRSFVIYVFFGIIIAVFVVNFGPQSAGCTSSTSYAGKVAGKTLTMSDFQYAASVFGLKQQQGTEEQLIQLKGMVMDQLLARELMADDALAMGLNIPNKEIEDMIFRGRYLALGRPRPLVRGDNGEFDYERFSRYARYYWGVTPKKFKEQQRRELLAEKLRQFLRTTVKVAEDEVRADYTHRRTQVKLSYVRLAPADFRGKVAVDPKTLEGYVTGNAEAIKKYYENNRTAFKKLPEQLRLQLIQVSFDEAGRSAAKSRARALYKRVTGGEDFGKVAAEGSDDDSKTSAGIIGWRDAAKTGFGSKVTGEVKGLKKGAVSKLIETDGRFMIVKVLDAREGDVTLEQAKLEIGRKLYAESKALDAAKTAAAAFIKRAKGGEKLSEIFTADGDASDDTDTSDDDKKADDKKADDKKADDKKADDKKADDKKAEAPKAEAPKDKSPLKLAETAFFPLSPQSLVPRIGISKEITAAAFNLKKGEVAAAPFVVGKMVYLVAVADRKEADLKQFDKEKAKLMEDFAMRKWNQAVRKYAHDRCVEAKKNNKIDVQKTVLLTRGYIDAQRRKGKAVTMPPYEPCATLAQPTFPVF